MLDCDAARGRALAALPDVITPFPGGAARSGSKVGSIYKGLTASTAEAFCPTLRGKVDTTLCIRMPTTRTKS
ncbi:MAG: hypothetical protein QM811_23770 [Pirellulales bacterium]